MRKYKIEIDQGKDSKASNQQRMLNPQDNNSKVSTTKLGFRMPGCYCGAAAPPFFLVFPLSLPCTRRVVVAAPYLA